MYDPPLTDYNKHVCLLTSVYPSLVWSLSRRRWGILYTRSLVCPSPCASVCVLPHGNARTHTHTHKRIKLVTTRISYRFVWRCVTVQIKRHDETKTHYRPDRCIWSKHKRNKRHQNAEGLLWRWNRSTFRPSTPSSPCESKHNSGPINLFHVKLTFIL